MAPCTTRATARALRNGSTTSSTPATSGSRDRKRAARRADWSPLTRVAGGRPIEPAAREMAEMPRSRSSRSSPTKKKKALDAGGLYVLGTERHESRRIDNQLRGRSGRQGDPGRSKFYLSLEDDLMRIFGSDRMDGVLQTLGLQEGEAITHPWINKALEMAQQKVEARNFDIRKHVLKYDDVMNDQRKVIFEQRIDIMGERRRQRDGRRAAPPGGQELVAQCIPPNAYAEQWNTAELQGARSSASSASICRSTSGPPRKASPTRRSASGCSRRSTRRPQRQGGRVRARDHAPDREDGAAADARSSVARAPRHARAPAPGDRLPRLRPARSAQRVQVRRLPRCSRPCWPTCARRSPASSCTSSGCRPRSSRSCSRSSCRRCRPITSIRSRARTSSPWPTRRWPPSAGPAAARRAARAAADAQGRRQRGQSEGPGDLGQGVAQRAVPVRLGQEVQALPRQARLMLGGHVGCDGPAERAAVPATRYAAARLLRTRQCRMRGLRCGRGDIWQVVGAASMPSDRDLSIAVLAAVRILGIVSQDARQRRCRC